MPPFVSFYPRLVRARFRSLSWRGITLANAGSELHWFAAAQGLLHRLDVNASARVALAACSARHLGNVHRLAAMVALPRLRSVSRKAAGERVRQQFQRLLGWLNPQKPPATSWSAAVPPAPDKSGFDAT